MSDIYSKAKRSQIMSLIKTKATNPEVIVQTFLRLKKIAFSSNVENMPGKPDIVLSGRKIAIFIHGCFWHSHTCASGNLPKTNRHFWETKLKGNRKRDRKNTKLLKEDGWLVLTIWQCQIRNVISREIYLNRLTKKILSRSTGSRES